MTFFSVKINLLQAYYDTIIGSVQNGVPKDIMHHMVKNMSNNISSKIFAGMAKPENEALLVESSEIAEKRQMLMGYKEMLIKANSLLK